MQNETKDHIALKEMLKAAHQKDNDRLKKTSVLLKRKKEREHQKCISEGKIKAS